MKQPTVAAGLVRTYFDYAISQGVDAADLLARSGLHQEDLQNQDARVPLTALRELVAHAKALTGDPAFILHHAMQTEFKQISVVGLIVHSCRTMGEALIQLNRYGRLMVEIAFPEGRERFAVEHTNKGVWIVDNRPDPNSFPELTEANFARFASEFAREFPDRRFALRLEVTHARPSYSDIYDAVFKCPITFDAPRNALLIANEWLMQEFDDHSEYVFGLFTEKADALLAELEQDDSLRGRIEALILPDLHKGEVSVDTIASALGMSRQTLYRHLKAEGVTFGQIFDDLRLRLASDYLTARKVSVNETAYLVGFSEASSFVRAFRRWTGKSPAEFRAALRRT